MSGEPVTPAARYCGVCAALCGPRLGVIPVCDEHWHIGDAEVALHEQHAALSRWLKAMDAATGVLTAEMSVDAVVDAVTESQAAHDNLERVARKVVGQ